MSDVKAAWELEFARHLFKALPGVDGGTAAQIAKFMWERDSALPPAQSAKEFVGRRNGLDNDEVTATFERPELGSPPERD